MTNHAQPKRCPHCGSIISKREITIYRGLVFALGKVYRLCKEKETNEFSMKDIKHLLGHNNYARFGDLVMFGGLIYKRGRAQYGLNMARCEDFFNELTTIPTKILKDPITKQITVLECKTVNQIPGLVEFLDEKGLYEPKYKEFDEPRQPRMDFNAGL